MSPLRPRVVKSGLNVSPGQAIALRPMPQNQKPMVRKRQKARAAKRLAEWRQKQESQATPAAGEKKPASK